MQRQRAVKPIERESGPSLRQGKLRLQQASTIELNLRLGLYPDQAQVHMEALEAVGLRRNLPRASEGRVARAGNEGILRFFGLRDRCDQRERNVGDLNAWQMGLRRTAIHQMWAVKIFVLEYKRIGLQKYLVGSGYGLCCLL